MAKMTKAESKGVGILIVLGGIIYLFQEYPMSAIAVTVILVVLFFLNLSPSNCDLCNSELKRKSYEWKIAGEKKTICPNCNRQLERKASKEAVSKL